MYSGRNLKLNKSREIITASRIPYKTQANQAGYETELEAIEFDSNKVFRFGNSRSEAVFVPNWNTIYYHDELYEQRLHEYLVAHERFHEIDHKAKSFGRLSRHLNETDITGAYLRFYNTMGYNDPEELKIIEGTATLFGLFYGGRPWALERFYPDAFKTIHKLHYQHGGGHILSPEYNQEYRSFIYGHQESPWFGPEVRMSQIYLGTGWDSFRVIRPILKFLPSGLKFWFTRQYNWDFATYEEWALNPTDPKKLNQKVKPGDLIIRHVRPERVNQFTYRPL